MAIAGLQANPTPTLPRGGREWFSDGGGSGQVGGEGEQEGEVFGVHGCGWVGGYRDCIERVRLGTPDGCCNPSAGWLCAVYVVLDAVATRFFTPPPRAPMKKAFAFSWGAPPLPRFAGTGGDSNCKHAPREERLSGGRALWAVTRLQ